MDATHNNLDGGAALVGANWYRFRAGENISHRHVASVCYVWAIQGKGTVKSGGQIFKLTSDVILRLPWLHHIEYQPDSQAPFHLGTIHLVPWHADHIAVEPRVAFAPGDPLLTAPWRTAGLVSSNPSLKTSRTPAARNFIALASYGIERFSSARTDESFLRALGGLLVEEGSRLESLDTGSSNRPAALETMMDFVVSRVETNLDLAEVARAGLCSPATANRLFKRHTGQTVAAWSTQYRMQEAASLLRSSGLRVNEIARLLGFSDPLYFSRAFARYHGMPPTAFAANQLRP